MASEWIENFLYQGRPASSDQPSGYHVTIGQEADDPFTPGATIRRLVGPMTPDAAEAMGYPASTIVTGINDKALADIAALQLQVHNDQVAAQAASDQITALTAANAALTAQVAELTATIAQLTPPPPGDTPDA